MPTYPSWHDLALRLALTLVAGAIIGIERGEHGKVAGLRTTVLVCLAASVAMIQTNLLLTTHGKLPGFFATFDVMRLPLGILTGVGFIGAGAIIRRHDLLVGVTTAATLWFVTVIGLCFGGGQIGLGIAATVMAVLTLSARKWVEPFLPVEHRAKLIVTTKPGGMCEADLRKAIEDAGFRTLNWGATYRSGGITQSLQCEVQWRGRPSQQNIPGMVGRLAERDGVLGVDWRP